MSFHNTKEAHVASFTILSCYSPRGAEERRKIFSSN